MIAAGIRSALVRWPIVALMILITGVSACRPGSAYYGAIKPPVNHELRIGLGSSPETLDPPRAAGGPEEAVIVNLFEGLTEYDPQTAAPIPALAERWEVNDDATEYTFHLKPEARWSNNDPVTADDFVYSWRRALDPATASQYASMLYAIRNAAGFNQQKSRLRNKTSGEFFMDEFGGDVAVGSQEHLPSPLDPHQWERVPLTSSDVGVDAVDEHTLRVDMQRPTAFFLSITPHWTLRPVHRAAVERWGREWTKPNHIVSNGPYLLAAWQPGEKLVVKKNPAYWGAAGVQIEQATFYLAEDTNALLNLYRVGEIDTMVTGLLPVDDVPLLRQKSDYRSGPFLSLYFYMLNVKRPPLDKKDVRYALNLSLNRRQICDRIVQGGQRPASNLTPSDFGGTYPRPAGHQYDPAQAQRLMSQAGYPNGRGLHLRLSFNSLDIHRHIAEAVQAQWTQVFPQIQIELVNLEWQVFLDARRQRKFDIALRHWTADYNDPYTFLELMVSDSSSNYTGWANPTYDQLVRQANATVDQQLRLKQLAKAERLVLEDLPFIPVYEGVTFFLTKPYLRGWDSNILDKHPLKFVWISR